MGGPRRNGNCMKSSTGCALPKQKQKLIDPSMTLGNADCHTADCEAEPLAVGRRMVGSVCFCFLLTLGIGTNF